MKQLHDKKGLSLVEVLVALAVFSIIGVAITALMVQGLQVRRENALNTQAQAYASSVLESYKSHWANVENYKTFDQDLDTIDNLPDKPAAFALELSEINIDTECIDLNGVPWEEDRCSPSSPTSTFTVAPPLRRVTVKLIDQEDKVRANLVTEIGNPRP